MKLRTIVETVQDQVDELATRLELEPIEIARTAKEYGNRYWKWVLNQWYNEKIILPEDGHRVKETLENFHKSKNRLQEKDINKYKSLTDVEQVVEPLLGITSSNKTVNYTNLPGVEVVTKNGPYVTLKVSDPDSLAELGMGTKWCTRKDYPECAAYEYIEDYGYIFIILQDDRPVAQYTPDYEQIMDVNDEMVEDRKLLNLIPKPPLSDDQRALFNYALNVIGGRWPDAEPYIIQDPEYAFMYAEDILNSRWPEAEPIIMKQPNWAYEYARDVIGSRWLEAEPYIMKSGRSASLYSIEVIGGRWPEAEPYIMRGPQWAYEYARDVIKGRWIEAEPIIMKDAWTAYYYAEEVIGGRWPEAEPIILSGSFKNLYIKRFL